MTGCFGERLPQEPLIVGGRQTRKNSVLADDGYEHSFRHVVLLMDLNF
jgi:hypothetical protein